MIPRIPVRAFGASSFLTLSLLLAAPGPAAAEAAAPPAPAATRLFPDSQLVVRERISVEVVGRGPDLVLIPGLASSREVWRRTAERLRSRYRLHLVEVAGFAGEPARANAQGAAPAPVLVPTAQDIDGYLTSARLAPAVLIGHSLGGTMALWLAENRPSDVRRVLLVDVLPFMGVLVGGPEATVGSVRPAAEAMRARMANASGDRRAAARGTLATMVTGPADLERILDWSVRSDAGVEAQAFADDLTTDLRPGLASVRAPVTLLYPYDPQAGVPEAAWNATYAGAFKAAPDVRLVKVSPSRHFIMYDQPERFAAELDTFLTTK